MAPKTFIPLESNPEVMTSLARKLGLDPSWEWHDLYSLTEPDLLALVPRPVAALLFTYPGTEEAGAWREEEQRAQPEYTGSGSSEPIIFFPQIIQHACGLIGLIHCTLNGAASKSIQPGSDLALLKQQAIPLQPANRAELLNESTVLETAHAEAATRGQSITPPLGEDPGNAFVAFVKGTDNCLYELEGQHKGPINRGQLEADEDVLSQRALELGPLPHVRRQIENANFSCLALAKAWT